MPWPASGKPRAFQCLVYLHRYHEGTLSRMRTEYVIPLQGKISARIEQLADDIAAASSTAFRSRLTKERDKLIKQQAELQTFDEKAVDWQNHLAGQMPVGDPDHGLRCVPLGIVDPFVAGGVCGDVEGRPGAG